MWCMIQLQYFCFPPLADVCKNCDHVIARHEYTFSVVDDYQVRNILYVVAQHHRCLIT